MAQIKPNQGIFDTAGVAGLSSASGGTAIADNRIIRGDGTNGIQGSGVTLSDLDAITGVTALTVDNINVDGNTISSTNANGNVTITPNGTGIVSVSSKQLSANLIRKAADQTKTNNDSYSDITDFSHSLLASSSYKFIIHVYFITTAAADISIRLNGTATHTNSLISSGIIFTTDGTGLDSANVVRSGTVTDHGYQSTLVDGADGILIIEGSTTTVAAGTLVVQFAQGTADASNSTIYHGSTFEVIPVS